MLSNNGAMCLWQSDPHFLAASDNLHTLIDKERLFILYQTLRQVLALSGDIAECGVYRGGSALMLARLVLLLGKVKTLHLFDTFAGMPDTSPAIDVHRKGDFADTSLAQVREYLRDFSNTVSFYPGLFLQTLPQVSHLSFSMVHVDCDIYESVLQCCSFFYPRMQPGGVLVYDDYGFPSCPGAKMAVDSFFADRPEHPVYLPTGQAVVFKAGI